MRAVEGLEKAVEKAVEGQEKAVEKAVEGQEKAVEKAVESQEKAVEKAVEGQATAAKRAVEGLAKAVEQWKVRRRRCRTAFSQDGVLAARAPFCVQLHPHRLLPPAVHAVVLTRVRFVQRNLGEDEPVTLPTSSLRPH